VAKVTAELARMARGGAIVSEKGEINSLPHEYRIRLDDAERILIVDALAEHLRAKVRAAKRSFDIAREAKLLERLADPRSSKPSEAYWARHWSVKTKREIYKKLRELLVLCHGTVKRSKRRAQNR